MYSLVVLCFGVASCGRFMPRVTHFQTDKIFVQHEGSAFEAKAVIAGSKAKSFLIPRIVLEDGSSYSP